MNMPSDNYSLDQRLGKLDVPETRYKADIELHDRSQAFSSELLKLALGGIVVVGFLLANFPKGQFLNDIPVKVFFSASVVAFALSVVAALLQRFHASGAMFHHLQVIKLLMLEDTSLETVVMKDMRLRTSKFLYAHSLLKRAALLLVIAALFLSIAFIRMMFLV
ncbi:MAG: hypothetical protein ACYCTW_06225 [Sulfuricella sp.]